MEVRSLRHIDQLRAILAALRAPERGCEWDLRQTHASLAPFALEEAYEVVDAIERGDVAELRDELGDYLLQVVFHARLAEEAGHFDFGDVVEAISAKLLRRHPHVFPPGGRAEAARSPASSPSDDPRRDGNEAGARGGDAPPAETPAPVGSLPRGVPTRLRGERPDWEGIKAEERARRAPHDDHQGTLAGIASALPALTRAVKLQTRASSVGFDWNDPRQVLAKIREEVGEVEQELGDGSRGDALRDEIGDLLFAVANLARHVGVDPEAAGRAANRKFERRFAFIERELAARGSSVQQAALAEMEALWVEAKRLEVKRLEAERNGTPAAGDGRDAR